MDTLEKRIEQIEGVKNLYKEITKDEFIDAYSTKLSVASIQENEYIFDEKDVTIKLLEKDLSKDHEFYMLDDRCDEDLYGVTFRTIVAFDGTDILAIRFISERIAG